MAGQENELVRLVRETEEGDLEIADETTVHRIFELWYGGPIEEWPNDYQDLMLCPRGTVLNDDGALFSMMNSFALGSVVFSTGLMWAWITYKFAATDEQQIIWHQELQHAEDAAIAHRDFLDDAEEETMAAGEAAGEREFNLA